jgi:hypothetical protein
MPSPIDTPSPTPSPTGTPTPTPSDPVLVGAGDIAACLNDGDEATAELLDGIPGTVFTLGDHVYESGSAQEFNDCYEPSWGRHKARTRPVAGNHEYLTAGAAGYYVYFGADSSPLDQPCASGCKGYYSYDLGAWHIVVLNSECSNSGAGPTPTPGPAPTSTPSPTTSPAPDACAVAEMEQWLRDDLAANSTACTLAMWHKPVLTIGPHANDEGGMLPAWRTLYDHGADLVLAAHDHSYARYATLNREANGVDAGFGMRQIVVGTGGKGLTAATRTGTTPGLEVWQDSTTADALGVLKLTLHGNGYDWQFVPVAGPFNDAGSGTCHGVPSGPTPTPLLLGHKGPSFAPASAPTADKPQSKLWFNDGFWWASMFASGAQEFHIFRLDPATQTWTDTGTLIDARNGSKADVLWNGSKLYVATAGVNTAVASDEARVQRYSYHAATDTYTQDTFAVALVSGGMEALVLAQDTAGTLWVTYTRDSAVYVSHSTTSDFVWTAPYVLPVENAANLLPDDISSVIAYNSRIGVMWSNQNTKAFYFASHVDGALDSEWTVSTALGAPNGADDHISLRSIEGDTTGRVFAAVKTGANGLNDPSIMLLVLGTDGNWTNHIVSKVSNNHTRPILLIDEENRSLYVFASAPCCNGGAVYYKETSLDAILFPVGLGTTFMQSSGDNCTNNPTSTKQNLNSTTDLVVLAGADCTDFYFHNMSDLAAP